jgi:5-(carboxyamino)imidazole ribonucleotide mutase
VSEPLVGIAMGSASDLSTLEPAAQVLERFGIEHELRVLSAHRTPEAMADYARSAVSRGLKVIIAGAGGAAHLPGMLAANTPLPVIGVPVATTPLNGMDALLSIVQMPRGVPVATVAVGGGDNAGLLAVQILATSDARLLEQLLAYKQELADTARKQDAEVRSSRPS